MLSAVSSGGFLVAADVHPTEPLPPLPAYVATDGGYLSYEQATSQGMPKQPQGVPGTYERRHEMAMTNVANQLLGTSQTRPNSVFRQHLNNIVYATGSLAVIPQQQQLLPHIQTGPTLTQPRPPQPPHVHDDETQLRFHIGSTRAPATGSLAIISQQHQHATTASAHVSSLAKNGNEKAARRAGKRKAIAVKQSSASLKHCTQDWQEAAVSTAMVAMPRQLSPPLAKGTDANPLPFDSVSRSSPP